jgi:hypothetical protein
VISEPSLRVLFCDDVRQEVGNKLSYLGVYGGNLVVPAFPTNLVKLCCVFSLNLPSKAAPKSVTFKLLRDEDVIFEADMPPEHIKSLEALAVSGSATQALTTGTVAQFVSFPITHACALKARAIVDGKEIRGGGIDLQAADASR